MTESEVHNISQPTNVGEFGDVIRQVIEAYQQGIGVIIWAKNGSIVHATKPKTGPAKVITGVDAARWSATDCATIVEAARQVYCIQRAAPKSRRSDPATDSTARKAAKKAGLVITKFRGQKNPNQCGGYKLIEVVVAGANYDLSADEALKLCEQYAATRKPRRPVISEN